MADELIKRREKLRGIDKVKLKDWIKAAQKLGLVVTQPSGGSSHYAIRRTDKPDLSGFITVVYENIRKDDKVKVFKRLRKAGFEEDAIWEALGL